MCWVRRRHRPGRPGVIVYAGAGGALLSGVPIRTREEADEIIQALLNDRSTAAEQVRRPRADTEESDA